MSLFDDDLVVKELPPSIMINCYIKKIITDAAIATNEQIKESRLVNTSGWVSEDGEYHCRTWDLLRSHIRRLIKETEYECPDIIAYFGEPRLVWRRDEVDVSENKFRYATIEINWDITYIDKPILIRTNWSSHIVTTTNTIKLVDY